MDRLKSTLIGLILGGVLLASWSSPAVAQEEKDRKTKETVAMSQQVYEKLAEIQELIEGKDYASAQRMLDELKGKKGLSDYERAQLWNISGYSFFLQERFDDASALTAQIERDLRDARHFLADLRGATGEKHPESP